MQLSAAAADLTAGTVGGCLGIIVSQPFDVAKVRMQTSACAASGVGQLLRAAVQAEGWVSVYKGLMPPLASAGLVNAVVFLSYGSYIRAFSAAAADGAPPSTADVALGGAFAGFTTAFISNPTELVKCRQQVDAGTVRPGSLAVARSIYRAEGAAGLNRGFASCLLRDVPSFALYFVVYEWAKSGLTAALSERSGSGGGGRSVEVGAPAASSKWLPTLAAGGVAGVVAWTSVYPVDTLKSIIQTQPGASAGGGLVGLTQRVVRAHGAGHLWRGYGACMARVFLQASSTFFGYEYAMERLATAPAR
ncbi:unnamed protein product [Polarella glacialis]|uniref:Uncharacterized protein n=1 Tax=Polarella glacialis TaxID=89957 RepID=A0A813LFW7_POLGL|nr:unnamed protein product [Polarella glacialis]